MQAFLFCLLVSSSWAFMATNVELKDITPKKIVSNEIDIHKHIVRETDSNPPAFGELLNLKPPPQWTIRIEPTLDTAPIFENTNGHEMWKYAFAAGICVALVLVVLCMCPATCCYEKFWKMEQYEPAPTVVAAEAVGEVALNEIEEQPAMA